MTNETNRFVEGMVLAASRTDDGMDEITARLIEAAFSPIGMLIAAIVGGLITLVSVRMQHRGSPERAFIDKLQKQLNDDQARNDGLWERVNAQDTKLDAYRDKMEAQDKRIDELEDAQDRAARIETLLRAYVGTLAAHIAAGNPPPPPEPPVGLEL